MASEKCIGEHRPMPSPQIHGAVSSEAVSEASKQASKQNEADRPQLTARDLCSYSSKKSSK